MQANPIIFIIDEAIKTGFIPILSANTGLMKLNTIMMIAAGNNISPDSVEE